MFACHTKVYDDELHEIRLTLSRVSKDENIGIGLVVRSLIEVYNNIASVFILYNVQSTSIRFSRVAKGIEVCHRRGRQDTLKLLTTVIATGRHNGLKSFLLPKDELVHS